MTSKKLNIKTYITINMTLNPKKLAYYEKKYERNPLEDTLKFMSNKWTLHVLRDLFLGKSHFNEFKVNRPSLDNKALSRCLKTMQDNGLIYKTNEGNDPKNTQYFLTQKGRSLNKVFYELLLFALETDVDNEHYSEYEKKELKEMLENAKFGNASSKVLIEEYLNGTELSVFVLTDGQNYKILPEAKDYKRIGEGDSGLNTGGMGSVSPVAFADKNFMQKVEERIVIPTVNGLRNENIDYKGFIFIGLMNVDGDPYVIEYNVRMGDPETEGVMTRIDSDLVALLDACAQGRLNEVEYQTSKNTSVTVMLVSGGYPEDYKKGMVMTGFDELSDCIIAHAGTKFNDKGEVVTSGGRVIAVTAHGKDIEEARAKAYQNVEKIKFEGVNYRHDIGLDLMKL